MPAYTILCGKKQAERSILKWKNGEFFTLYPAMSNQKFLSTFFKSLRESYIKELAPLCRAELQTKIKEYRARFSMSQSELAELTGVRRETIIRLEKGQYNPSLKLAMDLAKIFGTTVEKIFTFTDEQ